MMCRLAQTYLSGATCFKPLNTCPCPAAISAVQQTLMHLLCAVLADMSLLLAASFKPPETFSCPAAHQCDAADPGEADSRCSEAVHLSYQEPAPQC